MRVMSVNDDILKTKIDPRKVIALYGDFESGIINVGYPAIAAYKPVYGNMWGYREAHDKGFYIILDDNIIANSSSIYEIEIDSERNVLTKYEKVSVKVKTQIYKFDNQKKKKRALV